jgi:hypothetical protein
MRLYEIISMGKSECSLLVTPQKSLPGQVCLPLKKKVSENIL